MAFLKIFSAGALLLLVPVFVLALETDASAVPEVSGPSISSVSVTDITDTSARIDVSSEEVTQGYVEYGTSEQYGMSTPLSSEFSTSPSFLLENLSPETLYHYRVIVMDSSGNAAITGDETFTTLATPPPEPEPPATETATTTETTTTAPPAPAFAISNTETVMVGTSTARVTWQTNKNADGQVEYGTTSAYGTLSSVGVVGSSHSVTLFNLTPNTKYYYRAVSKNSSGETAYSPAETFTTLAQQVPVSAPVISSVSVGVSASSATVTWITSKPATSDIRYGTTTSYSMSLGEDTTLKTSHRRILSNLSAGTLYHFRIIATDSSGNAALGKDRTFTTSEKSSSTPATSVPTQTPTATSTVNAETLKNIADQGAQGTATASRGGGGLPVSPTRPLLLSVTPLDGQVVFDWRKDRSHINGTINTLIIRKEGTELVTSRIDGDIVYNGPSITFTDTDVENGIEYHYALYSYGAYGRFTSAARFSVVPRAEKEQVEVSALENSDTAPPLTFTRDLYQGRQGNDVAKLQAYLADHDFYPEALVTGYFGPLTQRAVIRFQKLNDIVPAAGYVGPITKEVLAQ
ncbi:MAG: fibronectin type III domain-containing protein [Patescibacteria group bacterium]